MQRRLGQHHTGHDLARPVRPAGYDRRRSFVTRRFDTQHQVRLLIVDASQAKDLP
jgi:hypothetical protein